MEVSTFDPENNQGNWDRGQGRPKEFETDAEQTLWSLDYHYSHQLMFYFDVRNGKRSLLSRRNSDGAITVLVDVGVDDATKLTVDWLGDSIYFINRDANVFGHNSNPRIEQVSLEGRERRTVIRETELVSPSSVKEYQILLLIIERKRFILLIMIQLGCPEFSVQRILGSNLTIRILFLFD